MGFNNRTAIVIGCVILLTLEACQGKRREDTFCQGRCTIAYNSTLLCQCNDQCEEFSDCCADYTTYCSNSTIIDQEIYDISSQIWTADAINRVTPDLDWQGRVADGDTIDRAPGPLFVSIPPEFTTNALLAAQIAIYPYFNPDENIAEEVTPPETSAIDSFLTLVMATEVMQLTNTFLASKGLAPTDPTQFKAQLKDIWYTLYERQNTLGSSGGEHVQSGEKEDGNFISGLYNWFRFSTQEAQGHINYLGYVRYEDLGGAYMIRNPFYWDEYHKPAGAFFIGTSPAFDMAIFTLCFYSRPNAICNVELNSIVVPIQTYTLDYNGGTYVGTSYLIY